MKNVCGFIGWIFGVLAWAIFYKTLFPFLLCSIAGIYIGRYIGGIIENKQEEERQEIEASIKEAEKAKKKREQAKKRKEKEENERLRKQRRQEAISLCNKYPEAAKYYFKFHFGIEKERITQYHITHDKVGLLLAHSESDYKKQEAISLCNKYPEAAKYYFKSHYGIEMDSIPDSYVTDNRVGLLLAHPESEYQKQEEEEKAKKGLVRQKEDRKNKAISLCQKYPLTTLFLINKKILGFKIIYDITDKEVDFLLSQPESFYIKQEELEKKEIYARKREQEEARKKEEERKKKEEKLAQQKEERRNRAISLCQKYPLTAQYFFRNFFGQKDISDITDNEVDYLISHPESFYIRQEGVEKKKIEARKRAQEEARKKEEERKRKEEELARQKEERRNRAVSLCKKYPLTALYFFRNFFGQKDISDITDNEVDYLISHPESFYIKQEELENERIEARKRAQEEARKREEERKRREEELARQREEEAKRQLESSLRACVSSWETHIDSSLKHKYYYDYYPYRDWKDNATPEMRETWKLVWNFKNDPAKGVNSYDHKNALEIVINKVENTLRSTFGSKTEYLTFVCLTASTQRKTEMRYKEFAERVCKDLKMTNAYPYIWVEEDGDAIHDGGDGSHVVSHIIPFFKGKYVVLFDDVRTSGNSLEEERDFLENKLNAKVICTITIAQTR